MVDLTVDASYLSGAIHNGGSGTITTGVGIVIGPAVLVGLEIVAAALFVWIVRQAGTRAGRVPQPAERAARMQASMSREPTPRRACSGMRTLRRSSSTSPSAFASFTSRASRLSSIPTAF